jgi:acid phosphatase
MFETLESRALFSAVPHFDHVVVVMEENRGYAQIVGDSSAPYLNSLIQGGALFTQSYALTNNSQPNYLALFSGSTQGVEDESAQVFDAPNLASDLSDVGRNFRGYAESPKVHRHDPWESFSSSLATARDFSDFPGNYDDLRSVSMVVPNLQHDMHDGTISQADTWLKQNLGGYASWARTHNSLLIVTWDEDDGSENKHIATILYGAHVTAASRSSQHITPYNILRTIEAAFGLPGIGHAADASPISGVWSTEIFPDANGDGVVDLADFSIFVANYGRTSGATRRSGDFDGDGNVGRDDLGILVDMFNQTT